MAKLTEKITIRIDRETIEALNALSRKGEQSSIIRNAIKFYIDNGQIFSRIEKKLALIIDCLTSDTNGGAVSLTSIEENEDQVPKGNREDSIRHILSMLDPVRVGREEGRDGNIGDR